MEEREQAQDDAGRDRSLGRRRFLAGGVFGALAALLGRAPEAEANNGAPIIGGIVNPEFDTTTLLVQTPNTAALHLQADGPALSVSSRDGSGVVASSFLTQPPPEFHLPRAGSVDVSDAVGLIAAGGVSEPFSVTVTADARVGMIAGGGLDGVLAVTLTADARIGMLAAGGLNPAVGLTSTASVGLIAAGGLTRAIGVTHTASLRAGVLGAAGLDGELASVTVNAHVLGVGGFVPGAGLGVAGAAGGAALGGPPDISVGVAGNAAGEGIAVSGTLFGESGTTSGAPGLTPLASASLAVGRSVTVTAYGFDMQSPGAVTGGLFLADIGVLAASFRTAPSPTATAWGLERTGIIGLTDVGTAAHFEALGSGIGVEVIGPSVFDGPVTFTVGGHGTIPKRQKRVIVSNPNIRAQDLVTVTLNGQPGLGASVHYVVCHNGSFTLWLTNYVGFATPFSWVAFRIG